MRKILCTGVDRGFLVIPDLGEKTGQELLRKCRAALEGHFGGIRCLGFVKILK